MWKLTAIVVLAIVTSVLAEQPTTAPAGKVISLICIGDSITECKGLPDHEKTSSPAILTRELSSALSSNIFLANAGVSGTTTADWAGPKGLVVRSLSMAKKLMADHPDGAVIFSIMLGTNDSANKGPRGAPISPERYEKDMRQIVDALTKSYPNCMIFIHHPTWYSKNTHNTADYEGDSAHDRLLSYMPIIDKLVAEDAKNTPRHVYAGDTDAYDHFAKEWATELSPQQGKNGTFYLHPNVKGAESLGKYWAAAILKVLKDK